MFALILVVDIDDLVSMMRYHDERLQSAIANYDLKGSKIFHAKMSIRQPNMPAEIDKLDD